MYSVDIILIALFFGALFGASLSALSVTIIRLTLKSHTHSRRITELEKELANLERVRANKLYREAIEDYGFANAQAALRVAQLRQELEIVETILTVGKKTP